MTTLTIRGHFPCAESLMRFTNSCPFMLSPRFSSDARSLRSRPIMARSSTTMPFGRSSQHTAPFCVSPAPTLPSKMAEPSASSERSMTASAPCFFTLTCRCASGQTHCRPPLT
ncbi:hypothetical protein GUJ93_ZPchr0006g43538 [Zizania palustris]|uniref:Uncharacterized protein n=1 Tax=Zizania palustris TaxID=103762 RepID=A0A8J5VV69_ZIZPA|nr:hypothetical protein GUJ93_ZPchr0006g43538 [Zizania palustris]